MVTREGPVLSVLTWFLSLALLAGCASVKPFPAQSGRPNLTVEVQMEGEFMKKDVAELYIYEVRGSCEQFYLGYVDTPVGKTNVVLPVGKDLVLEFVRSAIGFNYDRSNRDAVRLRPQNGQNYRFRLRERGRSREVLFQRKGAGEGEFREYGGLPLPNCEKIHYSE